MRHMLTTQGMLSVALFIFVCFGLIQSADADIPLPGQTSYVNPNTQVYGTYPGYAGGGSYYRGTDPQLAGYAGFGGGYSGYASSQTRQNNILATLGVNTFRAVSTGFGKSSFGQILANAALTSIKALIFDPLEQRFLGQYGPLSLDNLYARANERFGFNRGNTMYAQAQDCINNQRQPWQLGVQNPYQLPANLTTFTTSGAVTNNTSFSTSGQYPAVGIGPQ